MSEQGQQSGTDGEGLDTGERARLNHALETRLAEHLDAAAATVRAAERDLQDATDRLTRAEQDAADQPYRSDPLVFMRESVNEEVEALERKTNPKKVKASYRFLLDRAVELAAAEVQSFHDDQSATRQEREHGVDACRAAVQRAEESLEAARVMQERVRAAEQSARQGLAVLQDKLTAPPES